MPIDIVCVALASSTALNTYSNTKPIIHSHQSFPIAHFDLPRQKVKPISQPPAMIRVSQSIKSHFALIEGCMTITATPSKAMAKVIRFFNLTKKWNYSSVEFTDFAYKFPCSIYSTLFYWNTKAMPA